MLNQGDDADFGVIRPRRRGIVVMEDRGSVGGNSAIRADFPNQIVKGEFEALSKISERRDGRCSLTELDRRNRRAIEHWPAQSAAG